jgi:DNA-directed RNA polymerase subunit RPC12/RpoP
MLGIAIEASALCPKCGEQIPLNALAPRLPCVRCGSVLTFPPDSWDRVFRTALRDGPRLAEGEGQQLTVLGGGYNFRITFGRQHPRFAGSKRPLDMEGVVPGTARDPESGEACPVRAIPEPWGSRYPGIRLLVGESVDLLPGKNDSSHVFRFAKADHPLPFSCPQCGAPLESDGSERQMPCRHCSTTIFIPDDLWRKLHPVPEVRRCDLWYDESAIPFSFTGEACEALCDSEGNLCLLVADNDAELLSFTPAGILRWRTALDEVFSGISREDSGLALLPGNRLLLWSGDKHGYCIFSAADGTLRERIGGSQGRQPAIPDFGMQGVRSLTVDPDGNLLLWRHTGKKDVDDMSVYALLRHTLEGEPLPLWPGPAPSDSVSTTCAPTGPCRTGSIP